MSQDDGLARASIAFDPMPTCNLDSGLADDGSLGRGEVFEGYEPVHKILLNHCTVDEQTYWDVAWASPLQKADLGQFVL